MTQSIEALTAELRSGGNADLREIILGALLALPVSGLLAIVLGTLTPVGPALLVLAAGGVQGILGFALAGRLARRSGRGRR